MDEKNHIFNADVIFGIVSIAISLLWILLSLHFKRGTSDGTPGPGVFPILMASCCIFFSLIVLIGGIKKGLPVFRLDEIHPESLKAIGFTILIFVVFFFIWYYIHYIPATIFMILSLGFLYRIKPATTILLAVIYSVVVYYVFSTLLKVVLNLR